MSIQKLLTLRFAIILILLLTLTGCGGGGGKSSPGTPTAPGAEVTPSSFDFGTVTVGNTPAPLEVKINSIGTASLRVSSIVLADETNFSIDLDGGSNPCGSSSPTILPGNTCTFEVEFHPTSTGTIPSSVSVVTNAEDFTVQISAISEAVSSLVVRINQVQGVCSDNTWTAYVSVTDQAGYAYTGLGIGDFTVDVDGTIGIDDLSGPPPETASPISIVAVLDYSQSITAEPEIVNDMEEGLVALINQMRAGDEAKIIKFNETIVVETPAFIPGSNKDQLIAAIRADFVHMNGTHLYEAVSTAIGEFAGAAYPRRAVLVLTDGADTAGSASPINLPDLIALANTSGVPIFPIGLNGADWTPDAIDKMTQMANDTGGQLYQASASDNIRNSYWQLASVLFTNQYVLTFNDLPPGPGTADMTIAVIAAPTGSDTKADITLCEP